MILTTTSPKTVSTGGHHSDDELFSIDNIVIDLDVHDADWTLKKYATELDYYTDKLIYIITNDYNGQFPEFNAVRSGRGVQLWIGLVSFFGACCRVQKPLQAGLRIFRRISKTCMFGKRNPAKTG